MLSPTPLVTRSSVFSHNWTNRGRTEFCYHLDYFSKQALLLLYHQHDSHSGFTKERYVPDMVTLHRQGCPGASDFTNVCCFLLLGLSLFPTTSSAAVLYTEPHRSRSSSTDSSNTQVTSEAIERLSKVFGIDKPPIRIHHRAPPQYMVDLYNSIAYQSGITKHKTPYDADVVRGLPDRGK